MLCARKKRKVFIVPSSCSGKVRHACKWESSQNVRVEVTKIGGYQTVDKTKQRERVLAFLKQKEGVALGGEQIKTLPKTSGGLEFDENGKWIGRRRQKL